jgi:membrane fusion protein (multidrug efflux system)
MRPEFASFTRTLRTLDADGLRPTLVAMLVAVGLIAVWGVWCVTARVPVFALSETARLEVERVHPVAATVAGRVISSALVLGSDVQAGDVLLEIEGQAAPTNQRTRLAIVADEIAALTRQIGDERQSQDEMRRASRAALEAASLQLDAAEAAARLASTKLERLIELGRQGLVPAAEVEAARADEQARRAELAAARVGIDRLRAEQASADRERTSRLSSLERERVALQGLSADAAYEIGRLKVRAPVAGRLGAVAPIQVGAVIPEGQQIASIIPAGDVRVVAEFPPPAVGRVQPGQRARVRLDGFPWTQYGRVDAVVTRVASETRNQRVRVELGVARERPASIPLQHGMPGVVEVEVERVAPFALLLRSAGRMVTGAPAPAASPAGTAGTGDAAPR